ncbi:hypothetical protein HXX01_05565, partial [Candidatus Nomurabacteria bacterium]|nr:hypothetical protein [Candidatus Nomurabacteria bacterium]
SKCWGNYDYDYNTNKSAFWRVIRQVVSRLNIADSENPEWPSHLVWSNLYKVAPATGGNPSSKLCSIQFNKCRSLLEKEIEIFAPKRLLCLTGGWAIPFMENFSPGIKPVSGYKYVESCGTINFKSNGATTVVIAAHPQGKTEIVWVNEVINIINVQERNK